MSAVHHQARIELTGVGRRTNPLSRKWRGGTDGAPRRETRKLFRRLLLTRLVELFDAGRLQFYGSRTALRDRSAFLRHLLATPPLLLNRMT